MGCPGGEGRSWAGLVSTALGNIPLVEGEGPPESTLWRHKIVCPTLPPDSLPAHEATWSEGGDGCMSLPGSPRAKTGQGIQEDLLVPSFSALSVEPSGGPTPPPSSPGDGSPGALSLGFSSCFFLPSSFSSPLPSHLILSFQSPSGL